MFFFDKNESRLSSLKLEGRDSLDFAHRIFSRNFKNLNINEGSLTCLLSAEGKILSLFWAIRQNSTLSLVGEPQSIKTLKEKIDHYHFAESFTVKDGPALPWLFGTVESNRAIQTGQGKLEGSIFSGVWRGLEIIFNLEADTPLPQAKEGSWAIERVKHLIPQPEIDFNSSTLVFEPGFEELCDENKGCYIGQEVVERVRSRGGHGVRRLALMEWNTKDVLLLDRDDLVINQNSDPIGNLTTNVKDSENLLSLGYLKVRNLEIGSSIKIEAKNIEGRVLKVI